MVKITKKDYEKMKKSELITYIEELEAKIDRLGRKEKFNEEQVRLILEARKEGKSIRTIAREFEGSVGLIHKIIKRKGEM